MGAVKVSDGRCGLSFDGLERLNNFATWMHTEGIPDHEMSDRIDVTSYGTCTEFKRFTNGRATPHKRIQDYSARQSRWLIKHIEDIRALWCTRGKHDGTKYRTKPLGPPLVYVVDGAVNFLLPTSQFCNVDSAPRRETVYLR